MQHGENMIDWEKTADLNMCAIDELKAWFEIHPQSHKNVVAICDGCGKIRKLGFDYYAPMCHLCSKRTPEAREAARLKSLEQWSNPDMRKDMAKIKNDFYTNNPNFGENQRHIMIEWNKDHPEAGEKHSVFMKERCNDPDVITTMSKIAIQYYKNTPAAGNKHSMKMKQLYTNNPEMKERISAREQGQDYDAGEWTGFIDDKSRPHVIPIKRCIKLNERFNGSEGHHITKSIVVFIPSELHNHIGHNLKTGENMGEINVLAIQFINGGL